MAHCTGCGAPLPGNSQFCPYCGTAVAAAPAPLASSGSPPAAGPAPGYPSPGTPPPGYGPSMGGGAPSRPRHRLLLIVGIVLVSLIVIGFIVSYFLAAPPPPVVVNDVNFTATGNTCGLTVSPVGYTGFNASTSSNVSLSFPVPNYNGSSCSIHGVSTPTTGFKLYPSGLPLTIKGGGSGSLNITIHTPSGSFNGNLTINVK